MNLSPIFFFSNNLSYLIGCNNELAKLHTSHPEACDKVGGVIVMHIDDLRKFALLWLHKTEEVRADTAHYGKNITGDIYESGWISEMYGYSFGAAEVIYLIVNSNMQIISSFLLVVNFLWRLLHKTVTKFLISVFSSCSSSCAML